MDQAIITVAAELRFLLSPKQQHEPVTVPVDGVNSLLHVVESLGVPRTEIGQFLVNGTPVAPAYQLRNGDQVVVEAPTRPQALAEQRFLLDVHLGTLARRMRLLGLDTAYHNDADDPELVEQAIAENRVLLTRDRGILRRRASGRCLRPGAGGRRTTGRCPRPVRSHPGTLDSMPGVQRRASRGLRRGGGTAYRARNSP